MKANHFAGMVRGLPGRGSNPARVHEGIDGADQRIGLDIISEGQTGCLAAICTFNVRHWSPSGSTEALLISSANLRMSRTRSSTSAESQLAKIACPILSRA